MTNQEFFDIVVGRKIRHLGWTDKEWFIPQKLRDGNFMVGVNDEGAEVGFYICFGYTPEMLGTEWTCLE